MDEAKRIIDTYRTTYPKITELWKSAASALKAVLQNQQTTLGRGGVLKIEGDDLAKLRAGKKADEAVGEDHEVSMGIKTLDSIIKHATELKGKLGMEEKDIPAWIQDHIAVAENNLDQANTSYHEYGQEEKTDMSVDKDLDAMKETVNEAAPEGWEKTVLAMKKHKEIDNPWALAHWMKKKGYHSQKKEE